jgi:hypothetical protein
VVLFAATGTQANTGAQWLWVGKSEPIKEERLEEAAAEAKKLCTCTFSLMTAHTDQDAQ